MYLADDRFATAVAFVEGYNAAFDGAPLKDFREFVAAQVVGHDSPVHWSYLIASTKVPDVLTGDRALDQLPADVELELTHSLIELLERYQESVPTWTPPEQ